MTTHSDEKKRVLRILLKNKRDIISLSLTYKRLKAGKPDLKIPFMEPMPEIPEEKLQEALKLLTLKNIRTEDPIELNTKVDKILGEYFKSE